MERVQDAEQTVEVFESDIDMYLKLFCERDKIEDMRTQSQSVWNSALRYIYKHVFANGILKQTENIDNPNYNISTTYNAYNYKLVLDVLDIYIFDMCMRYDKEVSILGFSTLTGIAESAIHEWGNGGLKLSPISQEIYKKLYYYREESLSNKLVTGKQNPVGVLGVLNRHYSWNLPGVSKERTSERALTAAELPKLGEIKQIESEKN
jgi:hypothetical protein